MVTAVADATRLNQIIAIRNGVKNDTKQALTKTYHLVQKPTLVAGLTRTYNPLDEEGLRYPNEATYVQVKSEDVLKETAAHLTRLFDVEAALDWTNQKATADVIITTGTEPVTLLRDVPVTYLMFLEKQLVDIESLIRKLPALDPAERWTFDPATDTYRTDPSDIMKSTKQKRNHVLAPATDKHPAQVEVYNEDVPVGRYTLTRYSGALPAQRINRLLARVTTLLNAVKFAREQANLIEIDDPKPGRRIFDYLFAPDE